MRRNFDRKAYQFRFVDSEHKVATVRTHDIAGYGEPKPVPSLLGGK
jgi:hypothetical protein